MRINEPLCSHSEYKRVCGHYSDGNCKGRNACQRIISEKTNIFTSPCKIGDLIYHNTHLGAMEFTVCEISFKVDGIISIKAINKDWEYYFSPDDIGKKVFFTKGEAERNLL